MSSFVISSLRGFAVSMLMGVSNLRVAQDLTANGSKLVDLIFFDIFIMGVLEAVTDWRADRVCETCKITKIELETFFKSYPKGRIHSLTQQDLPTEFKINYDWLNSELDSINQQISSIMFSPYERVAKSISISPIDIVGLNAIITFGASFLMGASFLGSILFGASSSLGMTILGYSIWRESTCADVNAILTFQTKDDVIKAIDPELEKIAKKIVTMYKLENALKESKSELLEHLTKSEYSILFQAGSYEGLDKLFNQKHDIREIALGLLDSVKYRDLGEDKFNEWLKKLIDHGAGDILSSDQLISLLAPYPSIPKHVIVNLIELGYLSKEAYLLAALPNSQDWGLNPQSVIRHYSIKTPSLLKITTSNEAKKMILDNLFSIRVKEGFGDRLTYDLSKIKEFKEDISLLSVIPSSYLYDMNYMVKDNLVDFAIQQQDFALMSALQEIDIVKDCREIESLKNNKLSSFDLAANLAQNSIEAMMGRDETSSSSFMNLPIVNLFKNSNHSYKFSSIFMNLLFVKDAEHNRNSYESTKKAASYVGNLDETLNDGKTALHIAVLTNNVKVTAALIEQGADTSKQDYSEHTALEYALSHNYSPMIEVFTRAGLLFNYSEDGVMGMCSMLLVEEGF